MFIFLTPARLGPPFMMGHSWGTRVGLVGFGGSGRVAWWPVFLFPLLDLTGIWIADFLSVFTLDIDTSSQRFNMTDEKT
jgi:hypothetical protein